MKLLTNWLTRLIISNLNIKNELLVQPNISGCLLKYRQKLVIVVTARFVISNVPFNWPRSTVFRKVKSMKYLLWSVTFVRLLSQLSYFYLIAATLGSLIYLNTYPKVKEGNKGFENVRDKLSLFRIELNEIDRSDGRGEEGDTNNFILQWPKLMVSRKCQQSWENEVAPLRRDFEETLQQTEKPIVHAKMC